MEERAGQKGIVVVVTLPFKGVDTSGKVQDALVVLPGLLVGGDQLVLRMKGGVVLRSLKEMRGETGFNVQFLDLPTRVVPPNMIENFEMRLERLAELLSLDLVEDLLSPHKVETSSVQDEALRAAEGPSGLPGVSEEPSISNTHLFHPRYVTEDDPLLRGMMHHG